MHARKLDPTTASAPVLLVDDDPHIRATVRGILADEGVDVLAVSDGEEALATIDAGARPSLILLDLTMPGMDGVELMSRLRQRPGLERTPVYVFSAVAGAAEKARRLGAAGLVPKPVQLVDLLAVVQKHRM